jgi:hypothetical protein
VLSSHVIVHRLRRGWPAGRSGAPSYSSSRWRESNAQSRDPKSRTLPLGHTSSWVARESNSDHLVKSQVHHRNACDPHVVPRDRIERSSPGLQPGASPIKLSGRFDALAMWARARLHRRSAIRLSSAPSSPCRCRPRGTVDSRAMQSAPFEAKGSNLDCAGQSRVSFRLDEPRSSRAGGSRTLVASLKGKCSTVELRPRDDGRSVFDEDLAASPSFPFVGELRIELRWTLKPRDLQSRQEPRLSARPKTTRAARVPLGSSRSLRLFQPGLCVWSHLIFGVRLALDTDGPAGKHRTRLGRIRPCTDDARMPHRSGAPYGAGGFGGSDRGQHERRLLKTMLPRAARAVNVVAQ